MEVSKKKKKVLVTFDMDSTLVPFETMDEALKIILKRKFAGDEQKQKKIVDVFEKITQSAMGADGIPFSVSFGIRMAIFKSLGITEKEMKDAMTEYMDMRLSDREEFKEYQKKNNEEVKKFREKVAKFKAIIENLRRNNHEVKILTNGSHTFADIVVGYFGLESKDVWANELKFDKKGVVSGYKINKELNAKDIQKNVKKNIKKYKSEFGELGLTLELLKLKKLKDKEGFLSGNEGKKDLLSWINEFYDLMIHVGDGSNDAKVLGCKHKHQFFVLAEWFEQRPKLKNSLSGKERVASFNNLEALEKMSLACNDQEILEILSSQEFSLPVKDSTDSPTPSPISSHSQTSSPTSSSGSTPEQEDETEADHFERTPLPYCIIPIEGVMC